MILIQQNQKLFIFPIKKLKIWKLVIERSTSSQISIEDSKFKKLHLKKIYYFKGKIVL